MMTWAGNLGAAEVQVVAAASLKECVNAIADDFCRANPGVHVQRQYGATGVLAKQLANGMPGDIFIAANTTWLDYLIQAQVVEARGTTLLAKNVLVFAGVPGTNLHVQSMAELAKLKRIAIGSPASVPAGEYAQEALKNAGLWDRLKDRLLPARDVREALMYVEQGEADGAFVYRTDVRPGQKSQLYFIVPAGLYAGVCYPMGITTSGAKNPVAKNFYRYLQSESARKRLAADGFVLP